MIPASVRHGLPTFTLLALASLASTWPATAQQGTSVHCGDNLNIPGGHYVLTGDLVCSTDPAVRISADHVLFDLKGFTIQGFGGTGILVGSSSPELLIVRGVHVDRGTLKGFSIGLELPAVEQALISKMTVSGSRANENPGTGVAIRATGNQNVFKANKLIGNDTGFGLEGAFANALIANVLLQNNTGISLGQSGGNFMIGNSISRSTGIAISLGSSASNTIQDCTLTANGTGIYATGPGTSSNRILGNIVTGSTSTGIEMSQRAVLNTVTENVVLRSGTFDLYDYNPGCANTWLRNTFSTANQSCIH